MEALVERIDKIIEQVDGTMRIEGMPLSVEDKERIRGCAGSEALVEAEIQALLKKHSAPTADAHEQSQTLL